MKNSRLLAPALLALPALLLGFVLAPSAQAGTHQENIYASGYSPGSDHFGVGATVRFTQKDSVTWHSSTSNQGFWDSGRLTVGQSRSVAFRGAGTFRYHDKRTGHSGVAVSYMIGTMVGRGCQPRWSTYSTVPAARSFTIQYRRNSGVWKAYRSGTRTTHASFNPSLGGEYTFRARINNRSNSMYSGWSPGWGCYVG